MTEKIMLYSNTLQYDILSNYIKATNKEENNKDILILVILKKIPVII